MPLQFASRLNNVETSAIRELFKLLGKPGIISFAGGFPDSAMFDVAGIKESADKALAEEPGGALQYGATEGYEPLRTQLAAFMKTKGVKDIEPGGLIVTTGSQQALDLLGFVSRPIAATLAVLTILVWVAPALLKLVRRRPLATTA